jgi:hypothetical protein
VIYVLNDRRSVVAARAEHGARLRLADEPVLADACTSAPIKWEAPVRAGARDAGLELVTHARHE